MKLPSLIAGLALAAAALSAPAQDSKLGDIELRQPHARATTAGRTMGGGFVTLANRGADDRLVAASAAVAARVELHTMTMEGDVMRMRQVDAIALPAGKTVELKPGGLHMMFIGLKAPLRVGERVPVTLTFEKAGELKVDFVVQSATQGNHSTHQ